MPPVRSLLLLTLLAACELKPPPPKAQPAPGSGSAAAVEAKAPVVAPVPTPPPPAPPPTTPPMVVVNAGSGSGSGSGPAISEACQTVGVHITDILIANGDQTQRAFMEQERARTVRQSELSCQRGAWNDAKIKCFAAAAKFEDLDACNKLP
jgi:hypothetical protein